jgi:hypothetical protein
MITDDALTQDKHPALANDLLSGAKEIATFTGWSERQIYYIASKGELRAIFTLNGKLHARRSTLIREIEALEGHNDLRAVSG